MRGGVLSASLFGMMRPLSQVSELTVPEQNAEDGQGWDATRFGRDQIRGLVHRVFDPAAANPIRQVVFAAVDSGTDVLSICRKVGEVMAAETFKDVAIMAKDSGTSSSGVEAFASARGSGSRIRTNLWMIPFGEDVGTSNAESLRACLRKIRNEFDYSVVALPADGGASEAAVLGKLADGIILVLSAMRTRRASALKFRETLTQVRLLGTVLSDRQFPIPERLYRNL